MSERERPQKIRMVEAIDQIERAQERAAVRAATIEECAGWLKDQAEAVLADYMRRALKEQK